MKGGRHNRKKCCYTYTSGGEAGIQPVPERRRPGSAVMNDACTRCGRAPIGKQGPWTQPFS